MRKKMMRKVLPISMAAIMVASSLPAMAAPAADDPWSIKDVKPVQETYKIDGQDVKVTKYVDYYLEKTTNNQLMTDASYENAKVNVWVPENATENSPIIYMVDNSGWRSDSYKPEMDKINKDGDNASNGSIAAMALDNGYVVVSAGLRSRAEGYKSPVTVADAKAVIRYLKHNDAAIPGDADKIFITGTSGGGALSVAIGSNGNSDDFTAELEKIGACMDHTDDVMGLMAYCPITDLGHADGSYEFVYAGTKSALKANGYTAAANDNTIHVFSDTAQNVAPALAAAWADYVDGLGIAGVTADYDTTTLTGSGTLQDEMMKLLKTSLQGALDSLGYDAFVAELQSREVASNYISGTPNPDWQTSWITFSADKKTIEAIDAEGYFYYVGIGQALKPAVAFTNDGMDAYSSPKLFFNENNLFGPTSDKYGYNLEAVFNLDQDGLVAKYGSWAAYDAANGALIDEQMKMVDSIAYLTSADGETAPYWWVRHGTLDRDTSFANQTLLKLAMDSDSAIKTNDFAFEFGKGHTGGYAIAEVEAFIQNALADVAATAPAWDDADATPTSFIYTCDGKDVQVTRYTDYYLDKASSNLSAEAYENAKVNVWVPEGASADSPILYMVNNSGWRSNSYTATTAEVGVNYLSTEDGKANQMVYALSKGYIVVDAGLRSRGDYKSPVTVADAKAVIRYLRFNNIGDTDQIFITGTSGGGALSTIIGASGNSTDYYAELKAIGAAGMVSEVKSTIKDDVYGVVAYCPIIDLGHSDGSYEYVYAGVRQAMLSDGYAKDSGKHSLSDTSLALSPILGEYWEDYAESLGLKDEYGKALTANFDSENLTTSGSLHNGMMALLMAGLQEGLDELGYDAFVEALKARTPDAVYKNGTPEKDWQTSWITFSADKKTIKSIDPQGYFYYVGLGQELKPGVAFTNQGVDAYAQPLLFFNENNLYGAAGDGYGYNVEEVFNLDKDGLVAKYGSWDAYWAANKDLIQKQMKMTDGIPYLLDQTDGDTAPYWYVRHGSLDRDTSFANQTLLYYCLLNDKSVKTLDFKFEFGKGHSGSYEIVEADTFMTKALNGNGYIVKVNGDAATSDKKDDAESPKTGDSPVLPIFGVVVAVAAVAMVGTRKRVLH